MNNLVQSPFTFEQDQVGKFKIISNNNFLELFIVCVMLFFLTLIATVPAVIHWDTQMIGGSWDTGQNIWNFWWLNQSIDNGNFLPFFSDQIYAPKGVSLAFHTLQLFNGYQAVFYHKLFHMSFAAAYNTIILFSTIVGGLSCYLLARYLSCNNFASFTAAVIYTFSPYHLSRMHFGHLEIYTSSQFLPLIVLFVYFALYREKWYFAALAGILIALTGWQSLQISLGAALLAGMFFIMLGYRKIKLSLIYLLICAFVCLVFMLPVIIPMIRDMSIFQDQMDWVNNYSVSNSPDLLYFFAPDRSVSLLWNYLITKIQPLKFSGYFQDKGQRTVFLGFLIISLSFFSLISLSRRIAWHWWTTTIIFFILSLGPILVINQKQIIPLPYSLLSQIPLFSLGRVPARWTIFITLSLSILVGLFLTKISNRIPKLNLLIYVLPFLIFSETLAIPVKLDDRLVNTNPFYAKLEQMPSKGSLLDVPYDLYGAVGPACDYMIYQIVHRKPIVSGYISRTPNQAIKVFDNFPFIFQLRSRIYDDNQDIFFTNEIIQKGKAELLTNKIEFVILHRAYLNEHDFNLYKETLIDVIGIPLYEDDQIVLWHVLREKVLFDEGH